MTPSGIIKTLKEDGVRIKPCGSTEDHIHLQAGNVTGNAAMVSTEKQQLLRFMKNALEYSAGTAISSPAVTDQADYPVTYAQRRLLIIQESHPSTTAYNVPVVRVFHHPVDPAGFVTALEQLIARHESLRTIFSVRDGAYRQVILSQIATADFFEYTDLRHHKEAMHIARAITDAEAGKVFDQYAGPLISTRLIHLSDNYWICSVCLHHIICDGWSVGILFDELSALYNAAVYQTAASLPPLAAQYRDYAIWEYDQVNSSAIAVHRDYWQQQFAGTIHTLNFPVADHTIAPASGGIYHFVIPADISDALQKKCMASECSLFTVLLLLFKVLLYRYTAEPDLTVGAALAGREEHRFHGLIGFFIKTLALRTRLDGTDSFNTALSKVKQTVLDGFEHQLYPFDVLVDDLDLDMAVNENPLFNAMLVLQNPEQSSGTVIPPDTGTLNHEHTEVEAKFDLLLNFQETAHGLILTIGYRKNKFGLSGIRAMARHFMNLAIAFVNNAAAGIDEVSFMSGEEQDLILNRFNATVQPYTAVHIIELFQRQADQTPDSIAVACPHDAITYRQLSELVIRTANYLCEDCGVRPGDKVGFMTERGIQMVVSMLAILTSGAAYVPVDPHYPDERKEYILSDSDCKLLLVSGDTGIWRPESALTIISMDEIQELIGQKPAVYTGPGVAGTALAYLIYTSGSTGRPKGVAISHSNIANLLQWAAGFHTPEELSGMLAATSVCFDLSVYEIFLPLITGGAVIVVSNILALPEYQGIVPVSLINTVPSAINELIRLQAIPETVIAVNLAGEPLSRDCADKLYALPQIRRVNNLYAPSETTTYSTVEVVARDSQLQPSIGKPVANTRIYILDKNLYPVPAGVYGELYIAGAGVAPGYYNKPELTAARFLKDPFFADGMAYKTGDSGKWLPDGSIQLAGRQDEQIKIRGFRIELGEVNDRILKYAFVQESVVLAQTEEDGSKYLVAYIVPDKNGTPVLVGELRQYLEACLPAYMIPEYFVELDELPRTPNGKIDKQSLLPPHLLTENKPQETHLFNDYEQRIAALWQEVLGRKNIQREDDFFRIGGHSLKATRLVSLIHERIGVSLPLRKIFEHPTIAGQADQIALLAQGEKQIKGISLLPRQDYYELSHAQKRLWLMARTREGLLAYNMPYMFELKGLLDYQVLQQVAFALLERHEALRTSFPVIDGQPWMRIMPVSQTGFAPEFIDAYGHPAVHELINSIHLEEAGRVFNLAEGPGLFVRLLRIHPEQHILYFNIHHISADAWSIEILKEEAVQLYTAFAQHKKNPLKPLRVQYKEFAAWQNSLLHSEDLKAHREYWLRECADPAPLPELPADQPVPAVKTFRGNRIIFDLDDDLHAAIHRFCTDEDTTQFIFFLSVIRLLTYLYSGSTDITIGTAVSGRDFADLENQFGYYLNTLPLRIRLDPGQTFSDFIRLVKQQVREAFDYKLYPYDYLIDELQLDNNAAALFNVMLVTQQNNKVTAAPQKEERTAAAAQKGQLYQQEIFTKFDLLISFLEDNNTFHTSIEYNTDLFSEQRITALRKTLLQLIPDVLANPGRRLNNFSLLSADLQQMIVQDYGQAVMVESPIVNPAGYLEVLAATRPAATAISLPWYTLSYEQLNDDASRMAQFINSLSRYDYNGPVAILSDDPVVQLKVSVAAMKTGHPFLFLSPHKREQELQDEIRQAGAALLVTTPEHIRSANRLQWSCSSARYLFVAGTSDFQGALEQSEGIIDLTFWDQLNESKNDDILGGGWIRSDNGQTFTRQEMDEYAGNVRQKLLPFLDKDTRVIEIGCSTCITLRALAPLTGAYHGIELSEKTLQIARKLVRKDKLRNVVLTQLEAIHLGEYEEHDFDLVIINSTVNHFPGHNYLKKVIQSSIGLMKDNGRIFIGDVMDEALRQQMEEELMAFRDANNDDEVFTRTNFSRDLFVAKDFWTDLMCDLPAISSVTCSDKICTIENELTKYRYDVVLTIDKKRAKARNRKRSRYQFDDRHLKPGKADYPSKPVAPHQTVYIRTTAGADGLPVQYNITARSVCDAVAVPELNGVVPDTRTMAGDIEWCLLLLLCGAGIYLPGTKDGRAGEMLKDIENGAVENLIISPVQYTDLLDRITETGGAPEISSLRNIFITGAGLTAGQWSRGQDVLLPFPDIRLHHFFSIPEVYFAISHYTGTEPGPLNGMRGGTLLHNNFAHILDREMKLLPVGFEGDLHIGGSCICVSGPALLPDPFQEGRQLYRTGVRAYREPDGTLVITGLSRDAAEKIRQQLDGMEQQLKTAGLVTDVAIQAILHKNSWKKTAYYAADQHPDEDLIRQFLADRFYRHLLPGDYHQTDHIPYDDDGHPDFSLLSIPTARPGTEMEQLLAGVWGDILKKEQTDINGNFFKLGGNSISALKLVARINNQFRQSLLITDIFRFPTIALQAAYLSSNDAQNEYSVVETVAAGALYVSSHAQKRLFITQQINTGSTAYNMQELVSVPAGISDAGLQMALKMLVARHESLRTIFVQSGADIMQQILPEIGLSEHINIVDVRSDTDWQDVLNRAVREEGKAVFDLTIGPLVKFLIVRLPGSEDALCITCHHIISDGWSMQVLRHDLRAILNGVLQDKPPLLAPLKLTYKDFAAWQNNQLEGDHLHELSNYWRSRFPDEDLTRLDFPADFSRPAELTSNGNTYTCLFDEGDWHRFKEKLGQEECTIFTGLYALMNVLLYRYCGQSDIILGTVSSGRDHLEQQSLVGFFVQTLALRSKVNPHADFSEALTTAKETVLGAFAHQTFPFDMLVDTLNLPRDPGHAPLFDIMMVYQNTADAFTEQQHTAGVVQEGFGDPAECKFDLVLSFEEVDKRLTCKIEFNTGLYRNETITALARHLRSLLNAVLCEPATEIGKLPLLTGEEIGTLKEMGNNTVPADDPHAVPLDLFRERVLLHPDKTAVIFRKASMTYAMLDCCSTQLSNYMLKKYDVKPQQKIGVLVSRNEKMIPAIIAILKLNAVYVPIDPKLPADRIKLLADETGMTLLITDTAIPAEKHAVAVRKICLDEVWAGLENESLQPVPVKAKPTDIAYLIFTSGSTGKPKGVMATHGNAANLMRWARREFDPEGREIVSVSAPVGFDLSVFELFYPLAAGGTQVVMDNVFDLLEPDSNKEITQLYSVPSAMAELLAANAVPPSVRTIGIGGEPVKKSIADRIYDPGFVKKLYNVYGPSETTVMSAVKLLKPHDPAEPTIGYPVDNTQIYILDKNLQFVPQGVTGELYIGGMGVTAGYLNMPDVTAKSFIPDPFGKGIIYKTGDWGRWTADGDIKFEGRLDDQVKIRGYRVELGEIESRLSEIEGVREAAAFIATNKERLQYIVAAISGPAREELDYIRTRLEQKMPAYMVPSSFILTEKLPLSPSGKVDRKKLLSMNMLQVGTSINYMLPRNDIERRLQAAWQQVLGTADVGVHEDFFRHGGHSISAIRLIAAVNEQLNIRLPFKILFELKTIAALGQEIEAIQWIRQSMAEWAGQEDTITV